jgi:tetratricopeptide (TPR) repeat protein
MEFNPNNPVVKLCAQGMEAEVQGNIETARRLFTEAWETAADDFEAFTAAHYMARNQPDLEEELKWNLVALEKAVKLENNNGVLPSLYLNAGKSYEKMGKMDEAGKQYKLAHTYSAHLPKGNYGDMMRMGINEALKRTGQGFYNATIERLIDAWCERRELKPLALVLPACIAHDGDEDGNARLSSTLSYLAATRCLDAEEQEEVEGWIQELAAGMQGS